VTQPDLCRVPSLIDDYMMPVDSSAVNTAGVQDVAVCPTVLLPNPSPSYTHGMQRTPADSLSVAPMSCCSPDNRTTADQWQSKLMAVWLGTAVSPEVCSLAKLLAKLRLLLGCRNQAEIRNGLLDRH